MNLFLHEIKENQRSTITWALSLSLTVVAFLLMYPIFLKDAEGMQEVLIALPPAVRSILGLQVDSLFTLFGYYSYVLLFIVLSGAIQATNIGLSSLAKEGTSKTIDFLLTKPISRSYVVTAKLLASIVSLVTTNVLFLLITLPVAITVSNTPLNIFTFLLLSSVLFLVQMVFFSLGFVISSYKNKLKSPNGISLPLVFSFFIIGMFDTIIGVEKVRYLTPFKFFDFSYMVRNNQYEYVFLSLTTIIVMTLITLSYFIYKKRDIDAVV